VSAADLVARYYAAFNAGDMDAFLELLHVVIAHDINQGRREVGRHAFERFMERMNRCYREQLSDIVIMTGADDTRAAAEFVVHGEYLATDAGLPEARGQRYVLRAGAFFDIRDGRIARVTNYYNLEHWLKQVQG
jgi:steroid delta-isomerase-like uncharacterized protein